MSSAINSFQSLLSRHGYSTTKTRCLIFECLGSAGPVTMGKLTSLLKNKVDRASIYRSVDLFEKLGIIERLQLGWKYKIELSHQFNDHHHHLTCLQCSQEIPYAEQTELENSIETIARQFNFSVTGHQIEIRGICANCIKTKRTLA